MAESFLKYEAMRDSGVDPQVVYREAMEDGLDRITRIRLLRAVFSLSFRDAMEMSGAAETIESDRHASSLEGPRDRTGVSSVGRIRHPEASDFGSMDQFPLRWRWTDPRWNDLPPEKLSKIRPLVTSKAREIHVRSMAFFHAFQRRRDLFSQIMEQDASGSAGSEITRRWLGGLPVAGGQPIFVHWSRETAAFTDYVTFCEYWDDFCYPMSDVIVWPITEEWALHYHDDERLTFGARGG